MPASCAFQNGAHVGEVGVEAARRGERRTAGPGVGRAEAVGDDHVVVVDGMVCGNNGGRRVERNERRWRRAGSAVTAWAVRLTTWTRLYTTTKGSPATTTRSANSVMETVTPLRRVNVVTCAGR